MKKITVGVISVLSALLLCGCDKALVTEDFKAPLPSNSITHTIYIYMSGGDAEADYGSATEALREMTKAEYTENVKVIVETGGSNMWHDDNISADKLERFEVHEGGLHKIESIDDDNMGTSKTLIDFLKWGNENYPSKDRTLIIWGQGGGCTGGAAYDARHNYDSLTPGEIGYALSRSGVNYSMVGFDACMMSSVETAAAIAPYASYMTASEEYQPCGWDYESIFKYIVQNPTVPTRDVGKIICDSYYNKCVDMKQEDSVSIAVTDLSKISALTQAFDGLSNSLRTVFDSLERCRDYALAFKNVHYVGGKSEDEGYSNMLDLSDFSKQVSSVCGYTPERIEETLNEAVVHHVSGTLTEYTRGLGIFYPIRQNADELKKYFEITPSDNYSDFLRRVCAKTELNDGGLKYNSTAAWKAYTNETAYFQYASKIENNCYELNITGNMDIVDEVGLGIYRYDDTTGKYMYIGSDSGLTIDRAAGIYKDDDNMHCLTLNNHPVAAYVIDKGENYLLYSIPAYVDGVSGNIRAAYITKNNRSRFKVYGFWRGINAAYGISDKNTVKLKPYQSIEPFSRSYDSGEYYKMKKMTALFTSVKNRPLPDGEYKIEYILKDIYGKTIKADPSVMKVNGGKHEKS